MQFLTNYLYYLAQVATIVIAILIILSGIIAIAAKGKSSTTGRVRIKKINTQYDETKQLINDETLSKKAIKANKKQSKQEKKANKDTLKPRLFVIDFDGDINANATTSLRECVTAILLSANEKDEVLLRLQSPGGLVHSYGLASSQLQRLRDRQIPLTIAVDKVAASGGYMMASVANTIIAAPFAIIGSIGVLAQLPNFHRLLKKNHIDFEQITAGKYKRSLSTFGENTKEGREKMQHDLEDIHQLFQQHISRYRPQLVMDDVATGEYWHGLDALKHQLVDSIQTSDDFLLAANNRFDCFELSFHIKPSLVQRISQGSRSLVNHWTQIA